MELIKHLLFTLETMNMIEARQECRDCDVREHCKSIEESMKGEGFKDYRVWPYFGSEHPDDDCCRVRRKETFYFG